MPMCWVGQRQDNWKKETIGKKMAKSTMTMEDNSGLLSRIICPGLLSWPGRACHLSPEGSGPCCPLCLESSSLHLACSFYASLYSNVTSLKKSVNLLTEDKLLPRPVPILSCFSSLIRNRCESFKYSVPSIQWFSPYCAQISHRKCLRKGAVPHTWGDLRGLWGSWSHCTSKLET